MSSLYEIISPKLYNTSVKPLEDQRKITLKYLRKFESNKQTVIFKPLLNLMKS